MFDFGKLTLPINYNAMDTKKKRFTVLFEILTVLFSAVISAFGLHIFVYSANFAPSGVDGIATMLQKLTGVNAGVYTIAMNLPLLIWAFLKLNKKYTVYTIIFTAVSSVLIYVLQVVDFYQYPSNETNGILSSVFAGVILGVRTGFMIKIGSSTGGIDIIACMIQSKKPHVNIEKFISILCYVIIGVSFFVYKEVTSILLSVIQIFFLEKAIEFVLRDNRNAIEVKIVTRKPEVLKEKILFDLKHGATVVECTGMYTGEGRFMVITIINIRQLGELTDIIKEIPDTFIYYSDVTGIKGNFRWKKSDVPH